MSKLSCFKVVTTSMICVIKKWTTSVFYITIGIQIIFPCLVEASPFSFGQSIPEHINSVPMVIERFSQNIVGSSVNRTLWFDVGNQKSKFISKSGAESITGSIKSSSTVDIQRNPSSWNEGNHCDANSNDLEIAHMLLGIFLIFFIIVIGIINSLWVIIYTQRISHLLVWSAAEHQSGAEKC